MVSCELLAHLEHRHAELRRGVPLSVRKARPRDEEEYEIRPLAQVPDDIAARPWGGFRFVYKIGDVNQLPPVLSTPIYDTRAAPPGAAARTCGRIAFANFINPPDAEQAQSTVVVMENVLRQTDRYFLQLLDHVRKGTLVRSDDHVKYVFKKMLHNLPPAERDKFRGALHLVPTWKQGDGILFNYLQNEMTEPLAFMFAHFQTIKQNQKNCLTRESRFPKKQAMCVGSLVMLLHNFHVSAGLMNGALGIVRDIHYEDPGAMGRKDAKFYVIVEFPECTLTKSLVPGKPPTVLFLPP